MAGTSAEAPRRLVPRSVLLVCAVLLIAAGLLSAYAQKRVQDSQAWVTHSQSVQLSLALITAHVHRARANARTYLLTSREDALVGFGDAQRALRAELDHLKSLVSDNPAQQQRAAAVASATNDAIDAYAQELQHAVAPGQALRWWQAVQLATESLGSAEEKLLQARLARLHTTSVGGLWAIAGTVVLGLALLAALAVLAQRLTASLLRERVAAAEAERLSASVTLARREADFQVLADNISQLTWMADPDGSIVWFNRRWYDYTGMSPDAARGWGWTTTIDAEQVDRVVNGFKRAIAKGAEWEDTFPLQSADGSYRWFLSRALPIRATDGSIERWFGTDTDVTVARETDLRLRSANRLKDEFLATLSHELRNPLAPIVTASRLLATPRLPADKIRWCSEVIERQAKHLSHLLDDLLDVSRVTRGRLELKRQWCDPRQIVQVAVEAVVNSQAVRGHDVRVDIADSLPLVYVDPVRMAQIVTNLLSNACKFTDPGGEIRLMARTEGSQLILSIKDSGIGLRREDVDDIFNMFTQVRSAIQRSGGGLGIGLALVKGIVELHGGTITAISDGPGKGSEFVVAIPLREDEAIAASATTSPAPVPAGSSSRSKVVLADDNRDAADSIAMYLQSEGYDVRTAYGGEDAIRLVRESQPHVAILDIGMPGRDGYSVARAIRAMPDGQSILLVALTGWGQQDDIDKALRAGFDVHVTKPAEPVHLSNVLTLQAKRRGSEDRHGGADRHHTM